MKGAEAPLKKQLKITPHFYLALFSNCLRNCFACLIHSAFKRLT